VAKLWEGRALWYVGPGRGEIRIEPVAAPGPGELRVRALYGALSRGTERLVLAGHGGTRSPPPPRSTILPSCDRHHRSPIWYTVGFALYGRGELDARDSFVGGIGSSDQLRAEASGQFPKDLDP